MSQSSSVVTACSTPAGIHKARDGGTVKVASATVRRVTPPKENATCAQGWACGCTNWSARSRCTLARTGRCRVGT